MVCEWENSFSFFQDTKRIGPGLNMKFDSLAEQNRGRIKECKKSSRAKNSSHSFCYIFIWCEGNEIQRAFTFGMCLTESNFLSTKSIFGKLNP